MPYYAIDRIQSEEKRLFEESGKDISKIEALSGDENVYAMNNLTAEEKLIVTNKGWKLN